MPRNDKRYRTTLEKLKLNARSRVLELEDYEELLKLAAASYLEMDYTQSNHTAEVAEEVGCHCGNFRLKTMEFRFMGKLFLVAACYDCGTVYEY